MKEFTLTTDQFYSLGSQVKPLGSLSPLKPQTDVQKEKAGTRTVSPTLVDGSGKIRSELVPGFSILRNPSAYSYLVYSGRSHAVESTFYFGQTEAGPGSVGLSEKDGSLLLTAPGNQQEILETVRLFIGENLLRRLDYEYTFSISDAWVFFTLLDAGRQSLLQNHLEYQAQKPIELSRKQIYSALKTESSTPQWLAPYFATCLSLSKLPPADIDICLENLAGQDIININQNQISVPAALEVIVNEFLLTDGHLRLRSGVLSQDQPQFVDIRAVQGRSGSILIWSYDQQTVDIFSLSPAELMVLISGLIGNPAAHLEESSTVQQFTTGAPPPPEQL